MHKNIVIVAAVRTPFDKFGGAMKTTPSIELGRQVLLGLMNRAGLPVNIVEEIFYGSCMHAEVAQYQNIPARQAMLKAGFPPETLSSTVDRACCSSMLAVEQAYQAIRSGEREVVIAAGSENMSNTPYLISAEARWGKKLGHMILDDQLFSLGYKDWAPVSVDAGVVAAEYDVSREEQDNWALRSQQKYSDAAAAGKFKDEIIAVQIEDSKGTTIIMDEDQSPRPDVTYESLARLKTVYGSLTVTAGNAPGINSGAAALLIMSEEKAKALGRKVLAYIRSAASVADVAKYIARVPATAIRMAAEKAGITVDDLKLIEINEAFAVMPLVSTKILGGGDPAKIAKLRAITNVNGGAIAIGHPMGATGARLVMTMMYELRRRGGGYGAAAICGGLAQGDCIILQVV